MGARGATEGGTQMRARSVVAAAVAFGVVAAAIAAALLPTKSLGGSAPPRPGRIVVLPKPSEKLEPGMVALVPEPGTVRIEARMADPRGGSPFALRVFRAKRMAPRGLQPTLEGARLLGHELCAQLGRIYRGQFGWIDARNRFRPARIHVLDTPIECGDRWDDARSRPEIQLTSMISDPSEGHAAVVQAVAWGIGGRLTRTVELTGLGEHKPKVSLRGAFLVPADPAASPTAMSARFTYKGRASITKAFRPAPTPPRRPSQFPRLPRPIPGTGRMEYRTPDPGGGLPWGVMSFRTDQGGYCVTDAGRIVGNRIGGVNFRLGTFDNARSDRGRCTASVKYMPPKWTAGIFSWSYGGALPQSLDPTQDGDEGRITLRTLPGRTVASGLARPGVRSVTVASPRDVRTLIPSARAHSFLIVYDGAFPTGHFRVTATLADGSTRTLTQPAGFG